MPENSINVKEGLVNTNRAVAVDWVRPSAEFEILII